MSFELQYSLRRTYTYTQAGVESSEVHPHLLQRPSHTPRHLLQLAQLLISFFRTYPSTFAGTPYSVRIEVDLVEGHEVRALPQPQVLVERVPRIQHDVQREPDVGRQYVLRSIKGLAIVQYAPSQTACTHPPIERLLYHGRVPLRDEHTRSQHYGHHGEHREQRLRVRQIFEVSSLSAPGRAEAQ